MRDWKKSTMLLAVFLMAYYVPIDHPKVGNAIMEGFRLLQWYAVNHTLACVVPAMFIAGAISTFLSQTSVLRYLGPRSNRTLAYGVASVSGMILAVCSCSVLPMFAGIYSMGAGLGPASAFLYSGPAINVLAVFLSARVLGLDLGIARAVGAITFAVIIGLLMHFVFRRSEAQRQAILMQMPEEPPGRRPLWKTALFFASMVIFLIFSDWYNTNDVTIALRDGTRIEANVRFSRPETLEIQQYETTGRLGTELRRLSRTDVLTITPKPGWVMTVHGMKWGLAGVMGLIVALMTWRWFDRQERKDWMKATWDFGMLIVPLLFGGVFVTGVIGALIPESQVATWVGGNSLASNFIASFVGMIWYFATLTEIPIVEMLTRLGMGKGPALALLLAGPALSLPSILVIHKIIGARKTFVFCFLVVAMSTIVGMAFGAMA
jgi:uncharacterized protein